MNAFPVQNIFDIAVHLMDAQNSHTGSTSTPETKEYALRTPSLLNSLLDRVYPASDSYPDSLNQQRPVCPKVSSLNDTVSLDERLCTGVLPYGLAALLLTEDDPARADFFWQTFLEQLNEAKRSLPASFTAIEDVYSIANTPFNQFSRWP